MRIYRKVHGESAGVSLVVCVEYLPTVVDRRAVLLDGSPHSLDVAIEEQGVELTRRRASFANLQQVRSGAIFPLQG